MDRARPSPSAPTALPSSAAVFATSETLCGSTTRTLSDADWSFSIVPSENFTLKTRSGLSATTFSKFTLMPPTWSRVAASAGSSEKSSTPTTRGPAPSAKRNAVIDGPIDTSRSGREGTLKRHDMGAETARMEVLALAVPVIAPERDSVRAVFAAERDLEAPETDAFGLFGVALRFLDLGDEARVHDVLHTPNSIRGRQTCRV